MADSKHQLAWNLFVEVRKEILEYQKTRTQVIGFKITFVTAGVGLIVANSDKVSTKLFLLPAFAAIFFDLLVASQNVAIKRAGHYCLEHVEPIIRELHDWPSKYLPGHWRKFDQFRVEQATPLSNFRQHYSEPDRNRKFLSGGACYLFGIDWLLDRRLTA